MSLILMAGLRFGLAQEAERPGKPAQRVVLVELFTSEGCSSCPPADALLGKLDGMTTGDGVLVVGLSEHVTYWNNLGWVDPFSQQMFTDRQSRYGERFNLGEVYTPQVVVNGMAQEVGNDRARIVQAIKATASDGAVRLRIDSAEVAGGKVKVGYTVEGAAAKGAEVWAVIAEDKETSRVDRGENGGRTLTHVAVARSLTNAGPAAAGPGWVEMAEPDVVAGHGKSGRHVVLFVQEAGMGRVAAVESRELR